MAFIAKTPDVIKPLASDLRWSISGEGQEIYLTFDDGPTAELTYRILDILDQFEAKATFFCIGGNVATYPEVYNEILKRGHKTGNHTWNHMSGWEFSDFSYYRNILECGELVHSELFRPPYGRITRSQVRGLKRRYTIVMWDVLSGDWSKEVSPERCLRNVVKNTGAGSIVVFHDSAKAEQNVLYALPRALEHLSGQGYQFKALPDSF